MRVYVINDTYAYHGGSAAVCEYLRGSILDKGHELVFEASKTAIENGRIEEADAVLVNGEGTLHDDSQRSRRILDAPRLAQSLRKLTGICKASWFNMANQHDDVLHRLDHFTVRESLSRDQLLRQLRTDLFSPEFRSFVSPSGGQLAKFPELDMSVLSWVETLKGVQGCETLLTGRHRGMYAACVTRTPFVALRGNTPKIEGLIAWSGFRIPVAAEPKELATLLLASRKIRREYDALFDWMAGQPAW